MLHTYGMAIMNKRTTFSLDEETIHRLRKLAAVWHISQAEVVRKAIKKAESDFNSEREEKLGRLRLFHKNKGVKIETADAYLDEVAENRSSWGRN